MVCNYYALLSTVLNNSNRRTNYLHLQLTLITLPMKRSFHKVLDILIYRAGGGKYSFSLIQSFLQQIFLDLHTSIRPYDH